MAKAGSMAAREEGENAIYKARLTDIEWFHTYRFP